MATLARWLGPWARNDLAPRGIATRDFEVAGVRVRTYGSGARELVIAPGLHYAGADDPRLDRFCRVLAAAGFRVHAPFIADYLALAPTARAKHDFVRALDGLALAQRPIVFSISFGSLLAFHAAAERAHAIDRLVIFGGYRDLGATLAFALGGERRDPLNQPVVIANLLDEGRRAIVGPYWRRYVEATWGRPEMKARARFAEVARAIEADVPAEHRALFRMGVGVDPGAAEFAAHALATYDARALDPAADLARVRCRVDLVHGTDDDVIPHAQAHALAAALAHTDCRLHVTGLYGHTGSALPSARAVVREGITMARVLAALLP